MRITKVEQLIITAALCFLLAHDASAAGFTYVQSASRAANAARSSVRKSFPGGTQAGDLIIVVVSFDSTNTMTWGCSDSLGNTYVTAIQTDDPRHSRTLGICYAVNRASGADAVTVDFGAPAAFRMMAIHEYGGVNPTSPLDQTAGTIGTATTATDAVSSASIVPAHTGELIFGAAVDDSGTTTASAGTGFTLRQSVGGTLFSEEQVNQTSAAVGATFTFSTPGDYVAQLAAFNPAGGTSTSDTIPPSVPTNLAAVAASSSQINLSWNASTDNVAATGYFVYRNGVKVATVATATYADTGLLASTTYTYAVAAFDAAGNTSALSSSVSVSTTTAVSSPYSTDFPLTENPISEGGRWVNGGTTGLDWADVRTTGGNAIGTQIKNDHYNDSTAILTGTWAASQRVRCTVFKNAPSDGALPEVEIRLRSTVGAHVNTGYEVLFSTNGLYDVQIVRWNGLDDFHYINGASSAHVLKDGDIVEAQIVGNVIAAWINGTQITTATDSGAYGTAYATGNPGIGFYTSTGDENGKYGFRYCEAWDDSTAVDTIPPSVPANLAATPVSPSQVSLTWTPSTDNIAVAGYEVFRNGSQVGTASTATYADTGLTASTAYTYAVAAYDAKGNVSAQSQPVSVTTTAAGATTTPAFVQVNQREVPSGTSVAASYRFPTAAGNTIVAYVIWSNTSAVTLTDTLGNRFVDVGGPTRWGSGYSAQVFYATNFSGGADTVTATFDNPVGSFGVLYIHEYAGISTVNPVDVTAAASGASSTLDSGPVLTTSANDLIFGAGVSDNAVTAPGTGFVARNLYYGNITEDGRSSSTGYYRATAAHNGNAWAMRVVAFRPAQ